MSGSMGFLVSTICYCIHIDVVEVFSIRMEDTKKWCVESLSWSRYGYHFPSNQYSDYVQYKRFRIEHSQGTASSLLALMVALSPIPAVHKLCCLGFFNRVRVKTNHELTSAVRSRLRMSTHQSGLLQFCPGLRAGLLGYEAARRSVRGIYM